MITITVSGHPADATVYTQENYRHGVDSSRVGRIMHMAVIMFHHPKWRLNYKQTRRC